MTSSIMQRGFKPERNYLIHPHYIQLGLLLAGVSALFLGFTLSYIYNRVQNGLQPIMMPPLFYFNTLILLSSSYTMIMAKRFYREDNTPRYRLSLTITLILTIIFLVSQVFAWKQLINQNVLINHSTLASYLYLISGIHFAHVIIGIPFLIQFIYIAYNKMVTPVSVLIYFSDKSKERSLNLLNIYWHFLDILWIYLVLFFLVNYFI
jgi:cytochrome c oxidase subunit 3